MTIAILLALFGLAAGVAVVASREQDDDDDVQTFDSFTELVNYVNMAQLNEEEPVRVDGEPPKGDPVRVDPDRPRPTSKKSSKPSTKKSGPPAKGPAPRTAEIRTFGEFVWEKAKDIEIPEVPIPPALALAGGPVVQGILSGIDSLRDGLKEAFKQNVVTATGADLVLLDTRTYPKAKIELEVAWSYYGHFPVRVVRFAGTVTSTGDIPAVDFVDPSQGDAGLGKNLPLVDEATAEYLRTGTVVPGTFKKHEWIQPKPMNPLVQVLREGQDLRLFLFLPARGAVTGKGVQWWVTWTFKKIG